MVYEVEKIKYSGEFKVCPECGYADGFHNMFKDEDGQTKWLLICPECHKIYDIGLTYSG